MQDRQSGSVQDYTAANLILIFANLLWIFMAIWSYFGFGFVLILGIALNHLVTRLEQRKRAYETRMEDAVARSVLRHAEQRSRPGETSRSGGDTA